MKLCRVQNKTVGDKTYWKYLFTVPPDIVRRLNWGTATLIQPYPIKPKFGIDRGMLLLVEK